MFEKVESKNLLEIVEAPCDFYVSLSPKKYVKVIARDQLVDPVTVKRQISKGVLHFFIKKDDLALWTNYLSQNLKEELKENSTLAQDPSRVLLKTFSRIRTFAKNMGLSEDSLKVVEDIQSETINILKKDKTIFELLCNRISKQTFLSDHGLLTSTIACKVAIEMSWSTKASLKKFILAGLLHDISFEDESLSRIRTMAEIDQGQLTSSERSLILNHPKQAADFFIQLKISCPNTDKILLHHHELPDGSGFPNGLDAFNTPAYVCLFILAEELIDTLFHNSFAPEGWLIAKDRFDQFYNKGNYSKPIEGFKLVFPQLA